MRPDPLCALANPRQAPMFGLAAGFEDLRGDSPAIIADTQSKLIVIESNFDFNAACRGMLERISDHFAGDLIDLILKCQGQRLLFTLDDYAEARNMLALLLS